MHSVASVPRRFVDRTLDGYQATTPSAARALAEARRLLNGEINALVLIGQTGAGKTHLGAGVVNAILDRIAEREDQYDADLAAWAEADEEIRRRRPVRPADDPATIEAHRAWEARRVEHGSAYADYERANNDHWDARPKAPRPAAAWEEWDAEIPALEAMRQRVLALAPGPEPVVGPTEEDHAAHVEAVVAWRKEAEEHNALRPKHTRQAAPEWLNVAELIVGLRMEMDTPADDRDNALTAVRLQRHPALVVLDDLGREKVSDWTGETIYTLVNARYERMLPTLVTSNLTAAELAASPYWPVISRLAEDGALVEITAPDHRLAR